MLASIIILALFGIIMLCLEVVLPGAIIGIIGGGLVIASIVLTFMTPEMQQYGSGVQFALAVAIAVSAIVIFIWWMRYFHKTIIGRHLILNETVGDSGSKTPDLTGKTGVAKSDLRPYGTVLVDGTRYEAQSPTGFLPEGTEIKVSKCDGNTILVVAVDAAALKTGATEAASLG